MQGLPDRVRAKYAWVFPVLLLKLAPSMTLQKSTPVRIRMSEIDISSELSKTTKNNETEHGLGAGNIGGAGVPLRGPTIQQYWHRSPGVIMSAT
jgi:hypothetical protein